MAMWTLSSRLAGTLALGASILFAGAAAAGDRVALLIGNAAYDIPQLALENPVNDIDALAPALEGLGFRAARFADADRDDMALALDWLREEGTRPEIAFVFFAGHAVQVGDENYLIGTGLDALAPEAVTRQSLTVRDIRRALADVGAELSVIVVDACRDNPFAARGMVPRGLLPVSGGAGTLIAYSTDPGNVASDGTGDNSIFTLALLRNIDTPGLDVRLMFGRVRQDVVMMTGGAQIPWVEEAVLGEHYLRDGPTPAPVDDEIAAWRRADAADSVAGFETYLETYPEGLFARTAESRLRLLNETVPNLELAMLDPGDIAQSAAALEILGYLSPSRGTAPPAPEAVRQAFDVWRADQARSLGTPEALLRQGAQMALFLGTYTAGILRKDLQNFVAMEQNLELAEADLARARAEFGDDPAAGPALQAMTADIAAMRAMRDDFAARLDDSRSFYDDLVILAEGHLDPWMKRQPLPRFAGLRGLGEDVPVRVLEDARTFLSHLDLMADRPEGSYAWLADMIEESVK